MSELTLGGSWAGGWDEPGVLSVVLIGSTLPGSGLFVYSGTPANGTLVASVTAADGSDIFLNHFFKNFAIYTGNGNSDLFTALTQAGINWGTNQNGPGGTGHLKFNAPFGIQCDTITTWDPTAGFPTVEAPHTMSGFLNGWVATTNTPRYWLDSDGMVVVDGAMDASAATAATFFTMPAAYRPVSPNKLWAAGANGGAIAGQAPFVQVASTGSIAVSGITLPTAGAHVAITGRYPLD